MNMRCATLLLCVLLLAGCGGGGSSNSAKTTTPMPMGEIAAHDDSYTFYLPTGWSGYFFQDLYVLQNDTVPPGDSLTLVAVSTPAHGTVDAAVTCTFSIPEVPPPPPVPCVNYNPNSGFIGTDTFSYTVQDSFGRTASAQISVTITDHYSVQGKVSAPTGSIDATQVGFEGQTERTTIAADGSFAFNVAIGGASNVLVAEAPNGAPSLRAWLGSVGEPVPGSDSTPPGTSFDLHEVRLDAFSTAVHAALMAQSPAPPVEGMALDWPDVFDRATLIQLALEAGGASAGLPSPIAIASDASVRAQLRTRFGDAAIAQRRQQLLGDATLVPLLPASAVPTHFIAYAADSSTWTAVLFVQITSTSTAHYVTAWGGGEATLQSSSGAMLITPMSGPVAAIGPLRLQLIGAAGGNEFAVSVQSNGQLGNQLWNAELAPALLVASDGQETALPTVVTPTNFILTTHVLPTCTPPAGAMSPATHTFAFHDDWSGLVTDTNTAFEWMQSGVLWIRYADLSAATYIATTRTLNGGDRVIALTNFADGEQVLCAGVDTAQ
jgi:hypothetical protein